MTEPNRQYCGYSPDFSMHRAGVPPRPLIMLNIVPPDTGHIVTFPERTHCTTGMIDHGGVKAIGLMLHTPGCPMGAMTCLDPEGARHIAAMLTRCAETMEAAAATTAADMLGQLRNDKGGAA